MTKPADTLNTNLVHTKEDTGTGSPKQTQDLGHQQTAITSPEKAFLNLQKDNLILQINNEITNEEKLQKATSSTETNSKISSPTVYGLKLLKHQVTLFYKDLNQKNLDPNKLNDAFTEMTNLLNDPKIKILSPIADILLQNVSIFMLNHMRFLHDLTPLFEYIEHKRFLHDLTPLFEYIEHKDNKNQVDLVTLDQLYEQIILLATQPTDTNNIEKHKNFVNSLLNLHKDLFLEISRQRNKQKDKNSLPKNIMNSPAIKVAEKTTELLKDLRKSFSSDGQKEGQKDMAFKQMHDRTFLIKGYEKSCNETSGIEFFLKAVLTVVIAGIGFLVGAAVGMGIGVLLGSWTGYGAAVTGTVGLVKGAITGTAIGTAVGAAVTGVPFGMVAQHLLFKPHQFKQAVKNVAAVGDQYNMAIYKTATATKSKIP